MQLFLFFLYALSVVLLITTKVSAGNITLTPQTSSMENFLNGDCECLSEVSCECCDAINKNSFNGDKKFCANWLIAMKSLLKGNTANVMNPKILKKLISLENLPPACLPLIPQIPILFGCLKVHNVKPQPAANVFEHKLHACINATISVVQYELFNTRIGCFTFSLNGIQPHSERRSQLTNVSKRNFYF